MQIYAGMDQRTPLAEIGDHARRVEAMGYDGLNVPDAVHDGLLAAQAALRATTRLRVATSVLVCFPRSPMNAAHAAWDLQAFSGGRFELGLGTQVRGNIVGRYSTPWTPPVPRMREYVQSLRAIWDCWQSGGPLEFQGEHYRFTRMQPFFNPGPIEHPAIPIFLGAVGPKMTALVGEVADGIMTHPTNGAPRYLREVTLPEMAKGARTGRALATAARAHGGRLRRHRRDAGGRRPGAREDPGAAHLSLLDARLLADPRALRLGRRRSKSAPADARRALGRHGRGDQRRDARRPGAPGHLRRDRRTPCSRGTAGSPTASPFPYPTTRAPTRKPPR